MGELPEKLAKRGLPLFGALFGDFGDFRGKRCAILASQRIQVSRENGTPTFGGHLRGPSEGRFCHPKSTLGRISEMTPEGRCTVFSADLDSLGGQDCTPFSPEIPKISDHYNLVRVLPVLYYDP